MIIRQLNRRDTRSLMATGFRMASVKPVHTAAQSDPVIKKNDMHYRYLSSS